MPDRTTIYAAPKERIVDLLGLDATASSEDSITVEHRYFLVAGGGLSRNVDMTPIGSQQSERRDRGEMVRVTIADHPLPGGDRVGARVTAESRSAEHLQWMLVHLDSLASAYELPEASADRDGER